MPLINVIRRRKENNRPRREDTAARDTRRVTSAHFRSGSADVTQSLPPSYVLVPPSAVLLPLLLSFFLISTSSGNRDGLVKKIIRTTNARRRISSYERVSRKILETVASWNIFFGQHQLFYKEFKNVKYKCSREYIDVLKFNVH